MGHDSPDKSANSVMNYTKSTLSLHDIAPKNNYNGECRGNSVGAALSGPGYEFSIFAMTAVNVTLKTHWN